MIVIIIYAIISFLLDGLLSNYMSVGITDPSYFRTIFSVVALVIMLNYFDEKRKYLYVLVSLGLLFDIVYTNTFLLNTFIFYLIYFIMHKLNYLMPNNLFTISLKAYLAICLYHVLSFFILMVADYGNYQTSLLGNILLHSIISTIIYASVSYVLVKKIYFKSYSKKIK